MLFSTCLVIIIVTYVIGWDKNKAVKVNHRHLSNIDCLMARTACYVCFISTVNGHNKKKRKEAQNALEDVALVAGT